MRSRHSIDTSTKFTPAPARKDTRRIEVAAVDPVPPAKPPTEVVRREVYLANPAITDAVNLAIALGRPLLLQGDPGCGKTRLAYAVAYSLGLPIEECYIKSTTRAQDLLYGYDAVNRLYDAQLGAQAPKDKGGRPRSEDPRNYIRLGPLGRAIVRATHGRRSVVLIDEIDKADLDFPNDLLRELDRLEFEIPESGDRFVVPDDRPDLRPIIFVTHNEEKALPTAFLRRCIFHFVEFPGKGEVDQILGAHRIEDPELRRIAIAVVEELRSQDLVKKPGLAELLDWAGYLQAAKISPKTLRSRLTADAAELPMRDAVVKSAADHPRIPAVLASVKARLQKEAAAKP
jgi:MoxR-like ATPase